MNPTEKIIHDLQVETLSKTDEAKSRQAAAYVRVMLRDKKQCRRELTRTVQGQLVDAYDAFVSTSRDVRLGAIKIVVDALDQMMKTLEGEFSH